MRRSSWKYIVIAYVYLQQNIIIINTRFAHDDQWDDVSKQ
jgi:hypothetical protein